MADYPYPLMTCLTMQFMGSWQTCGTLPGYYSHLRSDMAKELKVKCNYCWSRFLNSLDACPNCGANDRMFLGVTL